MLQIRFVYSLASKFSSLCSLCTSSSCNVESNDAFADVLDCLTTKDADVAVTLYDKAKTFFDNEDNRQKYKYLCPNDAASPSDSPCVWTKQIRSVIVANRYEHFKKDSVCSFYVFSFAGILLMQLGVN